MINLRSYLRAGTFVALFVVAGCGGGNSTSAPAPTPEHNTPDPAIVNTGQAVFLRACETAWAQGTTSLPRKRGDNSPNWGTYFTVSTAAGTTTKDLFAGQTIPVGTVTVNVTATTVTVTYNVETPNLLNQVHAYISCKAPTTNAPGQFPFKATALATGTYTVGPINISSLGNCNGGLIYIAAHSVVGPRDCVACPVGACGDAPAITTTELPNAVVGQPYDAVVAATVGGGLELTWALTSGSLPTGLTLNADGSITGTPEATNEVCADYTFEVTVTDNCCEGTRSDVQTFTLTLDDDCGAAPEITSTPNVLPNAQVGVEYSYTFTATADPDLTLTWEMTAGNLPAGLTFDAATATLSGTPTDNAESCQDWPITVTVTDDCCNGARSDFGDFSFTLDPLPCDPLGAISPLTLPNAVQGVPYEAILTVEGGFAPFTWAIIDGTLPAGLELDADLGIISGTPTESGCLDFIVQVTDSCRCEAQSTSRPYTNFCVEIGCPPEVRQLTAGQTVDAGDVTISNDGTNLYVTYDLHDGQGGLVEAQVYVGFTPPPSCGPGTFPYNSGALDCLDAYTFVIPLADHGFDACAGQSIYIATHATVEPCGDPNVQGNTAWTLCADDPNGIECETGWGMACPYEFCCPGGA